MQRLIVGGLSVLMLTPMLTSAAQAQIAPAAPPADAMAIGMDVSPFNLVFLAYQGFLEDAGIPKFNALISAYERGSVSAQDLVRVAVDMGRLPSAALSDTYYINAVDHKLEDISSRADR